MNGKDFTYNYHENSKTDPLGSIPLKNIFSILSLEEIDKYQYPF